MKATLSLGAAALALLLSGCGSEEAGDLNSAAANLSAPIEPIAAPGNADWTQTVTETPEGGYRMGNPDAPVKLVEYASVTCPHCADFAEAASDPLKNNYVRSGQVSFEYRPFMLFPSDPGIFMLLRCQGPTAFFTLIEQLYAQQDQWIAQLQTITPDQGKMLESLSPTARSAAIIETIGLDQFFRQRGMPEARINSCLADSAGLERLAEITQAGVEEHQVQGTPTFILNGEKLDVSDWASLEPRLRAAIGR